MKEFNRHTIDLIARAVVSGRRGHGEELDRIADGIAGLVKNCLKAARAPGAIRAVTGRAKPTMNRETLDILLDRIGKHLASLVLVQHADDRSQTR